MQTSLVPVAYQLASVRGVAEAADNIDSESARGKTTAAFPSNSLTTSSASIDAMLRIVGRWPIAICALTESPP
jgi:hypothetical protein